MRNIKANYIKVQAKNPSLGACPCLVRAVEHKKFSRKSLIKAFNELIPIDDYEKRDKKELIDFLEKRTNLAEEGEIRSKSRL